MDQKLEEYGRGNTYPFHMPGHKRQPFSFPNPYTVDITEITGFDNLHHPTEDLADMERRWARLYNAKNAFFMVNGTTGGILTAVFSALKKGEELLLARNCHGSAYHGALLKDTKVHYIYPSFIQDASGVICGEISPKEMERCLQKHPKIKAVLFTSPTYEGVISDIRTLADIAHSYGVRVIVDAAHGAHFGICNSTYENPVTQGADLVVVSLHKTLPSLTQTALLLTSKDCDIPEEEIRFYLDCFETSSPSYVLISSGMKCLRYLEEKGEEAFSNYKALLDSFYEETKSLAHIKLLKNTKETPMNKDFGKLVILGEGYISGTELFRRLRDEFDLELEMAATGYCIAMTSIMDTKEGLLRLKEALFFIDKDLKKQKKNKEDRNYPKTLQVMSMKDAVEGTKRRRPLEATKDCVSAGFVSFYPPGIPILAPGELITDEVIRSIKRGQRAGLNVMGITQEGILIVD